jgi:hypothetical protein
MKLHILSDLHLGQGALAPPPTDADIVILAGDIARPHQAITWALGFDKPVLFVAGNHEFYGGSIPGVRAELKRLSADTNVSVLDDDVAVIGGVRFLGTTLWTDLDLYGEALRALVIDEAKRSIRDFSRIRADDESVQPFTPEHSARLFREHSRWLAERPRRAASGTDRRDHASLPVAQEHPSALRRFAAEPVFRLQSRAPSRRRPRATLDPRPHPRQLRLHLQRYSRRMQSTRLCGRRRPGEPAVRSVSDRRSRGEL